MTSVYIVQRVEGDYEDRRECILRVFADESAAIEFRDNALKQATDKWGSVRSVSDEYFALDADDERHEILEKRLNKLRSSGTKLDPSWDCYDMPSYGVIEAPFEATK